MQEEEFLEKTRKIRSVSIDTDVISDILALKLHYTNQIKMDATQLERCEKSFQLLTLIFSVKVKIVGVGVVKKELSVYPSLRELYDKIFDKEVRTSVGIKRLAQAYIERKSIKEADAFILASVSVGDIDCFFSWNRKHIVNDETIRVLMEINKKRNVRTPLIITPEDFLKRFIISQNLALCFSREVIPRGFLPRFSPSKQLL